MLEAQTMIFVNIYASVIGPELWLVNMDVSVSLSLSAASWSAVCDCGISCSYSLSIQYIQQKQYVFRLQGMGVIYMKFCFCRKKMFLFQVFI